MLKVHKIALTPNNKQQTILAKSAGTARFAYNWALAKWGRMYEEYKDNPEAEKPNQLLLRRKLNAIKYDQFPWMLEVTKCAPQEAIINLGRAFKNFFDGKGGYPTFKKKGVHDSFKVSSGAFHVRGKYIHIPKIGYVKMREYLRFDGKLISLTVSRTADKWFAAVAVEVNEEKGATQNDLIIGIDVGVNDFVRDSGEKTTLPKAYREAERHLRHAQKAFHAGKKVLQTERKLYKN